MFEEITWTEPTFIMTVGMPGSGKSTLAEQLASIGPRSLVRIASDHIIEKSAAACGMTYREIFPLFADRALRAYLKEQMGAAFERRHHVLLEQCCLSTEARKRYLSGVPHDYTRVALCCEASWAQVQAANNARKKVGRNVPYTTLQNMWAVAEDVTTSEGFDLILKVPKEA